MDQKEIMKNKKVSHTKINTPCHQLHGLYQILKIQKICNGLAGFLEEGELGLLLLGIKMFKGDEKVLAICSTIQIL